MKVDLDQERYGRWCEKLSVLGHKLKNPSVFLSFVISLIFFYFTLPAS